MGIVDVGPSTESAPATATATLAPAIAAKERYNYRSRKLTETNTSYVRVMALFAVLQTIALTFFTRGFLLSRSVLPDLASCESQNALLGLQENGYENNDACFHPAPFNKAVILIIDALRFDFTIPVPVPLDRCQLPQQLQCVLRRVPEPSREFSLTQIYSGSSNDHTSETQGSHNWVTSDFY